MAAGCAHLPRLHGDRRVVDIKSEMKETKGVLDGAGENVGYNAEAAEQLIQARHFDGVGSKLSRAREIMEEMTAQEPRGLTAQVTTSLASMLGSPFRAATCSDQDEKKRLSNVGPGRYQGAAVGSTQAVMEHARRAAQPKTAAPLPQSRKQVNSHVESDSDSDDYF